MKRLAVLLLSVAGLLIAPSQAIAHTELTASVPAAGEAVVGVPPTITLTFGEPIAGPTVQVGIIINKGDPVMVEGVVQDATVTIDTQQPALAALVAQQPEGDWVLAYEVTGTDGHAVTGTLTFSVAAAPATATAAPDEPTGSAAADNPATATPEYATDTADEGGSALPWWIIGGVVLAGLVGWLATRSRTTK